MTDRLRDREEEEEEEIRGRIERMISLTEADTKKTLT